MCASCGCSCYSDTVPVLPSQQRRSWAISASTADRITSKRCQSCLGCTATKTTMKPSSRREKTTTQKRLYHQPGQIVLLKLRSEHMRLDEQRHGCQNEPIVTSFLLCASVACRSNQTVCASVAWRSNQTVSASVAWRTRRCVSLWLGEPDGVCLCGLQNQTVCASVACRTRRCVPLWLGDRTRRCVPLWLR